MHIFMVYLPRRPQNLQQFRRTKPSNALLGLGILIDRPRALIHPLREECTDSHHPKCVWTAPAAGFQVRQWFSHAKSASRSSQHGPTSHGRAGNRASPPSRGQFDSVDGFVILQIKADFLQKGPLRAQGCDLGIGRSERSDWRCVFCGNTRLPTLRAQASVLTHGHLSPLEWPSQCA